jgi:hypothetical protein
MKLSTRLVLLILGCLLPILTAQVYSQVNLYGERHEQLSGLVLRQAELANADMASIIGGVHQIGALTGQLQSTRNPDQKCTDELTKLRQTLTHYRFMALFSPADGAMLCASDGMPPGLSRTHVSWLSDLLSTPDVAVGQLVSGARQEDQFLPIAVRIPGAGDQPRVLVVALNTEWLEKHLETARVDRGSAVSRAALIITRRKWNNEKK